MASESDGGRRAEVGQLFTATTHSAVCTLHCAPFCLYSARTHFPFFMGLFLRINSRTIQNLAERVLKLKFPLSPLCSRVASHRGGLSKSDQRR